MSRELYQEGVIIPPLKLAKGGVLNEEVLELFYRNVRTPWERRGDIDAQVAAGASVHAVYRRSLLVMVRILPQAHPKPCGLFGAVDRRRAPAASRTIKLPLPITSMMTAGVPICCQLPCVCKRKDGTFTYDLTGSAAQSVGCVNAVGAVTSSAVFYVVRCLVGERVPVNQGCMEPVTTFIPKVRLLNPLAPAAVATGNVETSQRVVDVLFGALAQLAPDNIFRRLTRNYEQLDAGRLSI